MNTATAAKAEPLPKSIRRPASAPIFAARGGAALCVIGGASISIGKESMSFDSDHDVSLPARLEPGTDYIIFWADDGSFYAEPATAENVGQNATWGGFHYAPGGNALTRVGGDEAPAINPCSIWDIDFRPACADPRGMALVDGRFWCDIYLCGTKPFTDGSSRHDVTIADGNDLPTGDDGKKVAAFDYKTATEIFAKLGKTLLGVEDYFAAAYGVTEATSIGKDPKTTKLDAPRTSKWGIMQAAGNLWIWGHDGDPDGPRRACVFGGSWGLGDWAGSRRAVVEIWPGNSGEWLGARGRSDHLSPG